MSYSVGTLPVYTKQDASKLLYAKLFNVIPTLQYCNEQTNIKSAETINLLDSTAFWAAQACSFTASGTDTLTQRTLTVGKVQIQKKWCDRDLEPYYTQQKLKKGGNYTSLAFNTEIVDNTMQLMQKDFEQALWMGDTASGTHNLARFDGFVKIINAATIGGTYNTTTWSIPNARTVVQGLAALVVADTNVWRGGQTSVKFFMNPTMAQQYRWKLVADNVGFSQAYSDQNKGKTFVEGTNIEIVEVPGLAGETRIYAIEPENMFFGTDMANEMERYEVWFSQDNREIRFHTEFKAGVQVAFPSRIYKSVNP